MKSIPAYKVELIAKMGPFLDICLVRKKEKN